MYYFVLLLTLIFVLAKLFGLIACVPEDKD